MSLIDEQIASLKAAIATGARRVLFREGGTQREVEYRSLDEMIEALGLLEAQLKPRRRVTYIAF